MNARPASQNRTPAEKTHARHNLRGDTVWRRRRRTRLTHGEQCRAERDEDVGAKPGRLSAQLALDADGGAETAGEQETKREIKGGITGKNMKI